MREAELQREAQTQPAKTETAVGGIAAIPRVKHGRAIDVPRTSVRDDLMTDGEPMPSVKAVGCNDHTPKRFW